jgi:protein-disulfide isomerase
VPQKPPVDRTVYKVEFNDVDAIKGAPNALITMVEFSEFQCPFCKKLIPTIEQLMKDYDGKIRLVFKQNPLPFHKDAQPAAMASLCAKEQGKFWEMHDKLFEGQPALDSATLEKYAGEIGVDAGKWKACMGENRYNAQILADQDMAGKVTARGTPNVFINGRKMTGAKPIDEFKAIIDEELKKAEAVVAKGVAPEKLYAELIKDGKVFEPLEAQVNEFKFEGTAVKGKTNAKIQVVLFSDFQCPFCSRVAPALEDLAKKYGDDVMIAFKNFPLDFHKEAKPAAVAALCANEQGKFWEFHNELFANQKALSAEDLKTYAGKIGLDTGKFNACVTANKTAQVDAETEEGRKAGVRGTPTIFINGRKFNSPSGYSVEAFSAVIDKFILGKAPAAPAPK